MKLPEVTLKDAAALLEQRFWIQGFFSASIRGVGVGYCAMGAIREVLGLELKDEMLEDVEFAHAVCELAERITGYESDQVSEAMPVISKWNDQPNRTKAHVVGMLKGDV